MGSKAPQVAAPAKSGGTPAPLRRLSSVGLHAPAGSVGESESVRADDASRWNFSMVRARASGAPGSPEELGGPAVPGAWDPTLLVLLPGLQPRLMVGAPDDPAEREAERLADLVTRPPERVPEAGGESQARRVSSRPPASTAGIAAPRMVEQALGSQGEPLDGQARSHLEGRFGANFSAVRVHTGAVAAASARSVHAEAYAVGPHLVFGAGRYAPATAAGRRLLAHELTHVLQQAPGPSLTSGTLRRNPPGDPSIPPPGTGYDGLMGSQHVGRDLNPQQKEIVREFRGWLESTRNDRGMWARRAGEVASKFPGTAPQRAGLYGELQRQMIQVHRSWGAKVEIGADGSRVFHGSIGRAFVVDPDGGCFVGSVKEPAHFTVVDGKKLPNYRPGGLTRIALPAGAAPGGAAPASSAPAPGGGSSAQGQGSSRAAPDGPRAAPEAPKVAPEAPRVAPEAPRVGPEAPRAVLEAPKVAPGAPRVPAGVGGAAAEAPLARGGLRIGPVGGFIIVIGVQLVLGWLIGKAVEASERKRIEELFRTSVDSEAQRRLTARNPEIVALVEDDPFSPVYTNITVTLVYFGSKYRGSPLNEGLERATVADLAVSRQDLSSRQVVEEVDHFSFGSTVPFRRTVRMVYSVKLPFESSDEERAHQSAFAAASKGTSARQAIGSKPQWTDAQKTQWVAAYVAETAGQPRLQALHDEAVRFQQEQAQEIALFQRFSRSAVISAQSAARQGMSARRAAEQTHWASPADRLRFVDAYVAVTAGRPEWLQLHQDAVAYAAELRGPGKALEERERQQILDWLRSEPTPR